jgi:hypothetical protein
MVKKKAKIYQRTAEARVVGSSAETLLTPHTWVKTFGFQSFSHFRLADKGL